MHNRTAHKGLSLVLALAMLFTLLPALSIPASAANVIPSANEWNGDNGDTIASLQMTAGGSDADNPRVITVIGTVLYTNSVNFANNGSGYYKFKGSTGATLKPQSTGKMPFNALNVKNPVYIELENITFDGNSQETAISLIQIANSSGNNATEIVINDGTTIKNYFGAASNFGVVKISGANTKLTMNGGTISGNYVATGSASSGAITGGVSISDKNGAGGTFIMTGGTISNNTCLREDGADSVYIYTGGTFIIHGGTITGKEDSEKPTIIGEETISIVARDSVTITGAVSGAIQITPDADFAIDEVKVNGTAITPGGDGIYNIEDGEVTEGLMVTVAQKAPSAPPTIEELTGAAGPYTVGATASPLTITASSTDDGDLSYQWCRNATNSNSGGTPIAEATGNTYTPATDTVGTTYYYCVVTNELAGSAPVSLASDVVEIIVNAVPTAALPSLEPLTGGGTYVTDTPVTLTMDASKTDDGILSYQWYSNTTNNNTSGDEIEDATEESYFPPTDTIGTTYYYCIVTNTLSEEGAMSTSATSDAVEIKVVLPSADMPMIETDPEDAQYVIGESEEAETLTVVASLGDGEGTLSYQWYRNTTNSTSGAVQIAGETNNSYTPVISSVGTTYYYCVVTNREDGTTPSSVVSRAARVTVINDTEKMYEITVNSTINGTISVDEEEALGGSMVTVTFLPAGGYTLDTLSYTLESGGAPVSISTMGDKIDTRTFNMPAGAVTIEASFAALSPDWYGNGTQAKPWLIKTPSDWEKLATKVNAGTNYFNAYFKLANDLDLSNSAWTSIGKYSSSQASNCPFSGTFDGDYHTINVAVDNTAVNAEVPHALFDFLQRATVRGVTVTGHIKVYEKVAAIALLAVASTIENCTNRATILAASTEAAGLVCHAGTEAPSIARDPKSNTYILSSVNYGDVSVGAKSTAAGILAAGPSSLYTTATIRDCYNLGTISGGTTSANVHGIVGSSAGLYNCYNAGVVTSGRNPGPLGGTSYNCFVLTGTVADLAENDYPGVEYLTAAELREAASRLGDAYTAGPNFPILKWQAESDPVTASTSVSDSTVTADITGVGFDAALDGEGDLTLNLTKSGDATSVVVKIAADTLSAMAGSNRLENLTLQTDLGNITLNTMVLNRLLTEAGDSENIALTIAKLSESDNTKAKERIDAGRPVYELIFSAETTPLFTGEGSGMIAIELPYTRSNDDKLVKVHHIASDGKTTNIEAGYFSGYVSFSVNHFSLFSIEEEDKPVVDPGTAKPDSYVWDGISIDVSWYSPDKNEYYISTPAQLMGLAAIVNGLYNEEITNLVGSASYIVKNTVEGTTGSSNQATTTYHYGDDDFNGKTVYLTNNIDMGGSGQSGPNFMPIGGQYLMTKNDYDTKLGSSFCGTFDGGGHTISNIYCDRHCSTGNYGDGASVGLIGRLGVHDGDPEDWRPVRPTVHDVAVTGYIYGNRHVGGIVGKIGKTAANNSGNYEDDGAVIENCANFATVKNTDSKGCGGIVGAGWNGGIVSNCYNAGNISTTYVCPTAGISGSNEITLQNCYNVGAISAPSSSFAMAIGTNNGGAPYSSITNCWYLEGSAPGGGYYSGNTVHNDGARTEAEMKSEDFLNQLGGAFAGDTNNINNGYPLLTWQSAGIPETYSINVDNEISGGSVTADPTSAAAGEIITLTVTPDEGKQLVSGSLNYTADGGATYTEITATDGVYSFVLPAADVTVTAQFEDKTQPGDKTSPVLTPDTTDNTVGRAVEITFTDDAAWRTAISGISINGVPLTGEQYTVSPGSINIAAGIFNSAGDHTVIVTAAGYNNAEVTQGIQEIQDAQNPCYLITPREDENFVISENQDGIRSMTVKSGVTGLKYFQADVTPVRSHNGDETLVFVHLRNGQQHSLNTSRGDFDLIDSSGAGFNVDADDIVKVYMVDRLTNDIDSNPVIFQ